MKLRSVLILTVIAAFASSCAPVAPTGGESMKEPFIDVQDQSVVNGSVTIAQVYSDGPGWIVIHADDNGAPGAVLGYTLLISGLNENVAVSIDETKATDTMYAMLHIDAGEEGVFEFPGADTPVTVNDAVVMKPFQLVPSE